MAEHNCRAIQESGKNRRKNKIERMNCQKITTSKIAGNEEIKKDTRISVSVV